VNEPVVAQIHVAKGRRLPSRSMAQVEIEAGQGIVGDRYHGAKHRQVSVQSVDGLREGGLALGFPIDPALTRRNITLSRGEVPRNPGELIRIGEVLLEVVRVAAPCRLLDDWIGSGAQVALRRRAGSVCRVLEGGPVCVGDAVALGELCVGEALF
jgi:MOSC domain-containing protein YiiM